MWFRNGNRIEYTGARKENDIVNWLLKRTGPTSIEVASCQALIEKVAQNKLVAAYFGNTSDKEFTDAFVLAAESPAVSDKYQFYNLNNKECAT